MSSKEPLWRQVYFYRETCLTNENFFKVRMKKGVYPGTFDPITYGHIDLIKRALEIVDELIVAVAHNPAKNPKFSIQERVDFVKETLNEMDVSEGKSVRVESFDGLLVNYVESMQAKIIIRGIRAFSDFENEFQMALTNRKFNPSIETIFLMPNESYSYISSNIIKEAARLGADISPYVPAAVQKKLKN